MSEELFFSTVGKATVGALSVYGCYKVAQAFGMKHQLQKMQKIMMKEKEAQ